MYNTLALRYGMHHMLRSQVARPMAYSGWTGDALVPLPERAGNESCARAAGGGTRRPG